MSHGDRVGVSGGRSLDALVAFLGILKVGAAYLPLDDTSPPRRLQAMVEEAGVQTVVALPGSAHRIRRIRTQVELRHDDAGDDSVIALPAAVTDEDCAYVMFTSGSTGRPKPVAIPHRGVVALSMSDVVHQRPRRDDRVLHAYNLSSDASTIEIWPPLLAGACIVIAQREELLADRFGNSTSRGRGHGRLSDDCGLPSRRSRQAERGEDIALRVGRWRIHGPGTGRRHRRQLPGHHRGEFLRPDREHRGIHGLPGSEAREILDRVPVGRPLEHTTVHVVRADGTPVDVDEEGELLVGGAGLALGYLGDPEFTARKFVRYPTQTGPLMYRTGDRVVRNERGELEYRGRLDRQIKLRGHRIELEEIEARLRADLRIGEAVVEFDGHSLIGYVTPASPGSRLPTDQVRSDLAKWLPAPAALSRLIEVAELPVGPTGKVDRKLLAGLLAQDAEASSSWSAEPESVPAARGGDGLVDTLARIWQNALRVWPALDDDFFAVGGYSLLAAQVVTSTISALGIEARHSTSLLRCLLDTPRSWGSLLLLLPSAAARR